MKNKNKKTKILVFTSSFPRWKNDWRSQFILDIYKKFSKKEFKLTVFAPHAPGAKRFEEMGKIDVVRFSYFYPFSLQKLTSGNGILHTSKESYLAKIQIPFFVMAEFFGLFNILLKKKIDIVHAHWVFPQGFFSVLLKFVFKNKVIITVHGSDVFALQKLNIFKAFALKHCDFCTVNSKATYKETIRIMPSTKIKIIPMGVDLKAFNPRKKDNKWRKRFDKKSLILLSVGRLIKCKGIEYLIKAIPDIKLSYPNIKLVIVGSGPEEKNLKKIAEDLDLKITKDIYFIGNLSHKKLAKVYASSNIFIIPSIRDHLTGEKEGQGLVVLEAMASGLPVIACNTGGINDVVKNNITGLIINEKDEKDISHKVIMLLSNPELRNKILKNGFNLIKNNYSWEKITKEFEKIY